MAEVELETLNLSKDLRYTSLHRAAKQVPNLFLGQFGHYCGHVSILLELDPPSTVVVALL